MWPCVETCPIYLAFDIFGHFSVIKPYFMCCIRQYGKCRLKVIIQVNNLSNFPQFLWCCAAAVSLLSKMESWMASTGCLECRPTSRNWGKRARCLRPDLRQHHRLMLKYSESDLCLHKTRGEFESDGSPDLNKELYLQDIHCVSSLCKAYFRELPNPLLTYQLYDKFAVSISDWNTLCCSLHLHAHHNRGIQ